ncbi:hypothetical protein GQ44DRAFT_730378 [Phaeosphaeriaceae sp. PMI808]|nr:hypothetical protein GQ44DRAFT_730378 [Phaeosphaeriaceae sp. PMI808]
MVSIVPTNYFDLPSQDEFVKALIPVGLSSTTDDCPICKEPYDSGHKAVRLPSCGHIYGAKCIKKWFKCDWNTCPMDRSELFTPPRRNPPILALTFSPVFYDEDALVSDGRLTRLGGREFITSMHLKICDLLRDDSWSDVPEDILRGLVLYTLPRGTILSSEAWLVLMQVAAHIATFCWPDDDDYLDLEECEKRIWTVLGDHEDY